MANVFLEARPTSRSREGRSPLYVVTNFADQLLGTFRNQKEAIGWARAMGHVPHVARSRHLKDKQNPDHWQAAE